MQIRGILNYKLPRKNNIFFNAPFFFSLLFIPYTLEYLCELNSEK